MTLCAHSQNTNIKPTPKQAKEIKKLTTPERLIEYSKGLDNEKNLIKYSAVQDSIIAVKDSIILAMIAKEKIYQEAERKAIADQKEFLNQIKGLQNQVTVAQNKITELQDTQLGIEKSKKQHGFYGTLSFGNGFLYVEEGIQKTYKNANIGLSYIDSKFIVGVSINPLNTEMLYMGKVGLKLF